jgi:hypothetical protein
VEGTEDVIAGRQVVATPTEGLDRTGDLMAEDGGRRHPSHDMQVGVAATAGVDLDQHLALLRPVQLHLADLDGPVRAENDRCAYGVRPLRWMHCR